MISDKQTLYLTGILLFSFFISGLFGLLNNILIKMSLALIFFLIIVNLYRVNKASKEDPEVKDEKDSI